MSRLTGEQAEIDAQVFGRRFEAQFAAGFPGSFFGAGQYQNHGDVQADNSGSYTRHEVRQTVGRRDSSCEVARCVQRTAAAFAGQYIIGYRGVRGPNSNTYAHWLLQQCGAQSQTPSNAYGWEDVPGWYPGMTPDRNQRGSASDF